MTFFNIDSSKSRSTEHKWLNTFMYDSFNSVFSSEMSQYFPLKSLNLVPNNFLTASLCCTLGLTLEKSGLINLSAKGRTPNGFNSSFGFSCICDTSDICAGDGSLVCSRG